MTITIMRTQGSQRIEAGEKRLTNVAITMKKIQKEKRF